MTIRSRSRSRYRLQRQALTTLAVAGIALLAGPWPFFETTATAFQARPKSGQSSNEPRPAKPAPPTDLPPPEDGGPLAYVFSTEDAIQFFQLRIQQYPQDFTSHCRLGEFYLREAEEGGGSDSFREAEACLREALKLNPRYPRAKGLLAIALSGQHRFAEGLALAEQARKEDPRDLDALAALGDALLELGRYEEAEKAFKNLKSKAPVPAVDARLANLSELTGKPEEAIALMRKALEQTRKSAIRPNTDAWYIGRLADLHFNAGQLSEAEELYKSVPQGVDAYHDATASLGRIRVAQGRLDEAIELYEEAIAIGPDPHMLVALGDLYQAKGDQARAEELYSQLLEETKDDPESYRERAMFLADHDRDMTEALQLARLDLEQRQDVFAYETLAWALHKNGQDQEAAEAIAEALKVGIQDARVHFHAGVIQHALGNTDMAREHLERALKVNEHFSKTKAEEARQLLKSLESTRD